MLNKKDLERILSFYQDALRMHGTHSQRSVHWSSPEGQQKRIEVLLSLVEDNSSLLDVGSGLGDMLPLARDRFSNIHYTGIDIVPEFILAATEKYGEGLFHIRDVFEEEGSYDYVLASGALSFKVENNFEFYASMIRRMYSLANKGAGFNMLRRDTHVDNETYASYDPHDIVAFCESFAESVEIHIDYLPQDFTIFLRK